MYKRRISSLIKALYLFLFSKEYYRSDDRNLKSVLISYIPEPFFRSKEALYMNKHQNRREMLIIADVFYGLGFNVHVVRFDKPKIRYNKKYDVIFGIEPNFYRFSRWSKNAFKIYYATGAYFEYQNREVISRTNAARDRYRYPFTSHRLVNEHNSCEIADAIFQIGTRNTIFTYPGHLRSKIRIVRQSCHKIRGYSLVQKIACVDRNVFLWFGGTGSILKGLDLLLEIFAKRPDIKLNIVGKMDGDFEDFYSKYYLGAKNIQYHGFLDIESDELRRWVLSSAYVILPSCTEGLPGSVINMMKFGLIPIVTPIASVEEIDELGITIVELSYSGVEEAIDKALSIDKYQFEKLIVANSDYAEANYNSTVFKDDLENALKELFKK